MGGIKKIPSYSWNHNVWGSIGPPELKETQDLIEKPFAILTLFGKLEIENQNQYI